MANKKKKRRRQSLLSKLMNAALIALGLSRPIQWFLGNSPQTAVAGIIKESTFGLSEGAFDLNAGLVFYSPVGAAVGLGKLKSYLMRKFPVR